MVLYRIYDKKTGKSYVGKTARFFSKRKKEHISLLKKNKHHNPHLQNIYNCDKFRLIFEILDESIENISILNNQEKLYIEKIGDINIAKGGEGGDTLSNHPDKEEIFKKRLNNYKPPKGKSSPCYKHLSKSQKNLIIEKWETLKVKSLKEVSIQTGISQYLCRRFLLESGYNIKNRNETRKLLFQKGLLKGSRNPNFTKKQKDFIRKRYLKNWVGCKKIAKELGFKSESPILKVVEELQIKRSRSEWTRHNNLNRKNKNE